MKSYHVFNFVTIFVSILFGGAIFWLWQDVFVDHPIEIVNNIPLSSNIVVASSTVVSDDNSTETVVDSPLTGRLVLGRNDINLDVPYTSQAPERDWNQPWQDACEEAAVLMLDAYYKGYNLSPLFAKDEMKKMIDWEEARGWESSIPIDRIKILLEDYVKLKRTVKIIENPTVEIIKSHIATGHPVLVVADGKVLPNPYYSNDGPVYHALIIRGYTEDKFIINDPGVNRGRNFVFKISDVMNAIHDWNNGDVARGKKVVIVVE